MSIYQLYGTTGAVADGLSSLDVQFDGDIVAYYVSLETDANAHSDKAELEVSFLSSSMHTNNDARGVIAAIGMRFSALTSGSINSWATATLSGIQVPVVAGERIYLHVPMFSGSLTVANAKAILYVSDTANVNLRRRR